MGVAAGLVTDNTEKKRLLGLEKDITAVMLDTGHCSSSDYQVKHGEQPYEDCKQAQETVARLETILKK